jgi:hypothetical protein
MDVCQRMTIHDESGGAVPALKGKIPGKSILNGGIFESFNGGNLVYDSFYCQHQA